MQKLLLGTAFLALATAASAQEETTVAMDQVPAAVIEAATANASGMTFESVAMDGEVYEFKTKSADGMAMEVDVMADGTIEEIEKQIDASALPAEVTAALEQNLAGFAPTMVEESTREGGKIIYEFEGQHDGKEIDAEINADGTGYTMNDDAAG